MTAPTVLRLSTPDAWGHIHPTPEYLGHLGDRLERPGSLLDQTASKQNSISGAAMVRVLAYDHSSENAKTFLDTLAVAGVDGTLDDRFRGTDLRGRIFGKSGFVNGVSCLSGYLNAKDGQVYAFSILINGIPELSNSVVKVLEERIVRAVDSSVGAMASVDH